MSCQPPDGFIPGSSHGHPLNAGVGPRRVPRVSPCRGHGHGDVDGDPLEESRRELSEILEKIRADDHLFHAFVIDTAQKFRQYDEDLDFAASLERALAHTACIWSGNFSLLPEPKGPEAEAEWVRNLEEVVTKFETLQATMN